MFSPQLLSSGREWNRNKVPNVISGKNCNMQQSGKGYFSFKGKGILSLVVKNPLENKTSLVNGESRYQDTQPLYLALPLSESKLLNFLLADSPSIKKEIIIYTSHTQMVLRLISVCHMFSGDKAQSYWEDKCSCPPCLGFQGLCVIVPNDPQSSGSLS